MDFVSPVLDVASRLCNCVVDRAVKVRHLPKNLNSLRTAKEKLNNVYKDVKERVEREESLEKKRTHVVGRWIQSVEAIEKEVNELLEKGDEEIQKKCLGTCCPKNCGASYKLAKMVAEKMDTVAALQTEGNNFQEVAAPLSSPQVIESLPQNLNSLRTTMEKLNNVYKDVKERVEREESLEKKRTHAVGGWIQSVEPIEKEVNELLEKGDEEIYKLAKMVAEKMDAVATLQIEGNNFQEVVVPLSSPQVIESLLQNLNSLRTAMEKLNNVYKDVKERVEREESLEKKRTHVVGRWIQSVEAIEKEANELLEEGDEEIQKKFLGTCCPKNCGASYKLAKMEAEKMDAVAALQTEGNNFQEVAAPLSSPQVIESLPQNLNSLRTAMEKLNNVYKDVKERVEREESLEKKRTHAVDGWIQSVEAIEKEVNELLAKGDEEIYKLVKMVAEKIDAVAALQTEGNNFQEVAVPLPSPQVIERPLEKPVGLDSPFDQVWGLLQQEQVGPIGIYGMGGVGKTTLLKKINNEFLKSSHDFDTVIWVVVSKPTNLQRDQETILSRLQIPDDRWKNRSKDEKAAEIFRILKTKKYVLLLDDIWEPFDLQEVGIPPWNDRNKSKIVFTTRSADVCGYMQAQKSIKVECLATEEAVTLFRSNVGEDTLNSHPEIKKLSTVVSRECKGLPLALVVMGRAMSLAKTPEEWDKKIQMLRNYPAKFPGMGHSLFPVLAFSYDSLPSEAIKSCFLYCSLFPEDYEISPEHLILLWIGEGFLDEYDSIQEARNEGEEIIASLLRACLLENVPSIFPNGEDGVKMHDVIRDMALWLACENEKKKNKFVVKDGVGLIRGQEVEKWKDTQRLSLWNCSLEEPREPPYFPNIKTLLASGGRMQSFPSNFFTRMPVIRVLDLSNNRSVTELPVEIGNLVTLQYLNLSNNRSVTELPVEIGNLVTLQYLNLSRTGIQILPVELKNLKKLRSLILDNMRSSLVSLPSQMISSLSSLQLFSMYVNVAPISYEVDERRVLEELEQLEHINDISIQIKSVLSAQTLFNSRRLQRFIRRLRLTFCNHLNLLQLSPYLETLHLHMCFSLEDVKIDWEKEVQVYSKFSNLRRVTIENCYELPNLTWIIYASSLQFLEVYLCISMEKVIEDERSEGSDHIEPDLDVFSRLISLTLRSLPSLRSIYGRALPFPSLRHLRVSSCRSLKKLPFDSNVGMSKRLEEIGGEEEWWDGLEWEDQTIMHNLTPYFRPRRSYY